MKDFDDLAREVSPSALRLAMRWTRNREDAEDLVATALIKAFRAFAGYRHDSNFKTWFLKIMRNAFLDGVDKRERRIRPVAIEPLLGTTYEPRNDALSPALLLESSIVSPEIVEALNKLDPRYRRALCLTAEGLSYEEIADALSVRIGTVRSRIYRARAFMVAQLSQ